MSTSNAVSSTLASTTGISVSTTGSSASTSQPSLSSPTQPMSTSSATASRSSSSSSSTTPTSTSSRSTPPSLPTTTTTITSSLFVSPSPSSLSPSSTSLSTDSPFSSPRSTPFSTSSTTISSATPSRTSTSQGHQTTFSSPVPVTSTNTPGQSATTASSAITSPLTSTASGGGLTTVTQVGVNPTLSAENASGKGSAFLHNTGAVVGVFTLVGLAAVTILLWIFFAVRRRRRTRQLEHDTAVSATLAAAGFNRTPLDDGDNDNGSASKRSRFGSPDVEMGQRSSSGLAIGMNSRPPSGSRDRDSADVNSHPYVDYIQSGAHESYVHARTSSPLLHGAEHPNLGHTATYSGGSYEPLLASYYRTNPNSPSSPTTVMPNDVLPTPPPRNPQRLVDIQSPGGVDVIQSAASSIYSAESIGDDRLDPLLRQRLAEGETANIAARDPRDDEDYSRPVLGVTSRPKPSR